MAADISGTQVDDLISSENRDIACREEFALHRAVQRRLFSWHTNFT